MDVVAAMLETCVKVSQKFSETQKKLTFRVSRVLRVLGVVEQK